MAKIKKQANITWKKVNNFITYLNRTLSQKNQTNKTNATNKTNKTKINTPSRTNSPASGDS